LLLSPYHGFLLPPFCGFIKEFCQERVIGDKEICGGERLVDKCSPSCIWP
jgi:hypothetical protein